MTLMSDFDERVALIRKAGIAPRAIRKKKADCTAEEWAALREYMAARYRDPRCKAMHIRHQLKYLAKKR